jgi:hypothetical protein
MMFGTQRFGIECHIRKSQGEVLIGDVWLWANGLRIGDEISGVDLPLVMSRLSGPLRLHDRRHNAFFDRLTKEQVVLFFYDLIFTDRCFPNEEASLGFLFRRHLVISAPDLEGFDSVFLLLLGCDDSMDRLIWKFKEDETVHEILLTSGEYSACVLSCFDWVEEQTGYRSRERSWLDLQEFQREELRQAILLQHPHLGEQDKPELLDQVAIEDLNRTRKGDTTSL